MSNQSVCPRCDEVLAPGTGTCPLCEGQTGKSKCDPEEDHTIAFAEEIALGRNVAIKIVSERIAMDEQARSRFLREVRLLAKVEHRNVVRVYTFGTLPEVAGFPTEDYRWSSYRADAGLEKAPEWLALDRLKPRFGLNLKPFPIVKNGDLRPRCARWKRHRSEASPHHRVP